MLGVPVFLTACREYTVYGGMPLALSMRTDEQKARYLERLFEKTYLKDVVERHEIRKFGELDDLVNVLASGIGMLTNPSKLENTFRSVFHSKISSNTISSYMGMAYRLIFSNNGFITALFSPNCAKKEFGGTQFGNVTYVNLDDNPRMREQFELGYDIPRIIAAIQFETGQAVSEDGHAHHPR